MMKYSESNYIEVAEAAQMLNVSPATIRRMFDAGILRGFRLPGGEHRRISMGSLREFLANGDAPKQPEPTEA